MPRSMISFAPGRIRQAFQLAAAMSTGMGVMLGLWVTPARPQASAPVDEKAVSDRVRREASNPMRIILEASRIKRRVNEGDAAAAAAPAAPAPTSPARPAAPAPVTVASLTPPRPQSGTLETVSPPISTGLAPLSLPALGLVPAMNQAANAASIAPPSRPAATSPAAPVVATAAATPRLLSQVTPEFPSQLQRRLGAMPDVVVEVTIERDGSVSRAALISGVTRAAEPHIVEALRQWRFAPLPQPVTQRLSLVFN